MPEKPAPDLDALLRYRQKRDFDKTPEPATGVPDGHGDLTFVIQQHAATRMHWDFRLEVDGVLVSWAVPRGPSLNTKDKRMAAHVEDHPFDYGGFEGVIPTGNYGAGQVIVWDNGTYTPDEGGAYSWGNKAEGSARMRQGLEDGKISITLRGKKLQGSWTLVRIKSDPKSWLLIKHRDEYVSTRDVLVEDRSVISGLTIQDLKEGRMPRMAADASGAPHPDARKAPFPDAKTLRPMLATLVEAPFSRPGWLFEPKLDGVRTLAFVRDGKVELRSRRGNPMTVQYPEVVRTLETQDVETAVFDGEIVAINEHGAPDFQELQPRINLSKPAEVERAAAEVPAYCYVFDLLYVNGYDLRQVPLAERKTLLRRTLKIGDHIKYVEHVSEDGEDLHDASVKLGFEGTVAKRANSTYESDSRSRAWLKVKSVQEQEFVVGGYTEGEGSRAKTFGGLLVGYYDGDELRYASSVGSGLNDATLDKLKSQLKKLETAACPFVNPPTVIGGRWSGGKAARCIWVKPELVVQVRFTAWTRDGGLRAPVFQGVRADVDPRSVHREEPVHESVDVIVDEQSAAPASDIARTVASIVEQLDAHEKDEFVLDIDGAALKLTNLNKIFWPATKDHPPRTKRDMIRYYARVAPYLLPHLKDRPLTLTRYPNGIDGKSFYQKHWPQPFPKTFRVERVPLYSSHNDANGDYILANNLPTLIWLAQLGDLEIHAWMARVDPEPDAHGLPTTFSGSEENLDASVLNCPDFMVFDLDPYIYAGHEKKGEEPALNRHAFEKTREVAFLLKDLLQQLRLSSFVKTTGKTGLHIYVPVLRHYDYDQIRAASDVVGRYLVQQRPDDITMEWAVAKRPGKIFFDHNQNTRGKTLAAEYSLRPLPSAAVSAPVTWEELKHIYPTDFDIDGEPERLSRIGDLWAHILDAKQDLRALIEA
ncbi:MAG: non-homologous end-joining DNA ligase [Chloroflexota bacterium]|nr:non-homologous end-joining DNA ligase [Chloroflexota bacterium]